jgi:hypothetical protein
MRAMSLLGRFVLVGGLLTSCASADKTEAPPRPNHEVATGGAQLRGGRFRMDVQIGRGLTKRPGVAGSIAVTPNAVVTP